MWILAVMAGILVALLLRSEDEKRHFAVDHNMVYLEKMEKEEKTLVFLSDLHSNCFGDGQKELLEAIRQAKPDGILIGGDMMVTNKRKDGVDVSAALFLVEQLAKEYPVFYGCGNHESRMERNPERYGNAYQTYRRRLEQAGVCFLSGHDRGSLGDRIEIIGLELEEDYYQKGKPRKLEVSYLEKQIGSADDGKVQILLAHSPMYFDTYAAWGADLSLSGHFHGGTIRLPVLGGVMTPQFQFFYPYCAGIFQKAGKYMIVSRGLGTHSVNIRLNNRAQLVVITLRQKTAELMDG